MADPKHGMNAAAQAVYVAGNLKKTYRPGKTLALVPLGRTKGFGQLPFGVVRWKFLVDMKRKDFFIGWFRKEAGLS